MSRYLTKSLLLLGFAVGICCIIYPAALLATGQLLFPFQANGSLLTGPDGKVVGSKLIAQPFTKNEYFWPRPSAAGAGYDASASSSSALAPSNYALRSRVAQMLGPIVTWHSGAKAGQPVAPDLESWFQKDVYQGSPHIVGQWANMHNSTAQGWVTSDATHGVFVDSWSKGHPAVVAQFIKDNPGTPRPQASDLAIVFFTSFSEEHPGAFPSTVTEKDKSGKDVTTIKPVTTGSDIQSFFFDMWRQDHPDADLENVPGDYVTTSASGLDPDITLQNAQYQLDRVSSTWATDLKRKPADVKAEVEQILQKHAQAPLGGLAGEKLINVLVVNLELRNRYGAPQ
jgi:potassium-transporting ATPase KdpC subunit